MGFDGIRRVRVGEQDVAYREEGDGAPLLLVHGWPLSSATWRKVVPALAATHRCIAPDLPGAGLSRPGPGVSLALGAQAEVVLGVADALGVDRFALCGHDSGGSIVRAAAVAAPDRVTELILADTEVPGHRPWLVVALQAIGRLPGAASMLGRSLGSRAFARSPLGFGTAFGDLAHFDFDEFHATLLAPIARVPEVAWGCHRLLRDFDFDEIDRLQARYEKLRMPTLLVWGEHDRFFPIAEGRRLAGMLPGAVRFEVVPGAGLLVHEERPGAWTDLVGGFLMSAPRAVARG
jgi:haloalkane dehalogenase